MVATQKAAWLALAVVAFGTATADEAEIRGATERLCPAEGWSSARWLAR